MERLNVIRAHDVMGYSPDGAEGKYVSRMLIDGESVGSTNLVLNHFTLYPGQRTYRGSHPIPFEEVYYILSGTGVLTYGADGAESYDVAAHIVAYIPAGMDHQLDNTGDTPLEMLTMMPFHPDPGANPLYDARKHAWGTSFKLVHPGDAV